MRFAEGINQGEGRGERGERELDDDMDFAKSNILELEAETNEIII